MQARRDKMEKRVISTSDAPAAVGAYSQAIECDGWLFCSGQVPLDPATGELISSTIAAETDRVMRNLTAVLEEAGADWSNVVKVTALLADINDFVEFNETYSSYVGSESPPARATFAVAGLPKGARIEVECIARL
jgi:2-iminobutanoate/2-iminopropanoate deaminase